LGWPVTHKETLNEGARIISELHIDTVGASGAAAYYVSKRVLPGSLEVWLGSSCSGQHQGNVVRLLRGYDPILDGGGYHFGDPVER
jgi:hypothetical protein